LPRKSERRLLSAGSSDWLPTTTAELPQILSSGYCGADWLCPLGVQAVFRAPDLSSDFVEAMAFAYERLFRPREKDFVKTLAEVSREVGL
jgi:hypothetical protein